MDKADITKTLYEYYEELMTHYSSGSILGVFLYGSQNYNFDTPTSDIDAKAIYIPRLEEIALLKQPVSREYHMSNGAHVEVKDIRLMWQMWKKQNINFVETLFTDYSLIHKWYTDKWQTILDLNEQIATYNMQYGITSACYQGINSLKKNEISGKKIANAARIYNFISKYIQNQPYRDCMVVSEDFKNRWLPVKQDNRIYLPNDPVVKGLVEQLEMFLRVAPNYISDAVKQKQLEYKMAAFIISLIEIRRGREFSML